jgi:hypothetical protein
MPDVKPANLSFGRLKSKSEKQGDRRPNAVAKRHLDDEKIMAKPMIFRIFLLKAH